jgi:hypothetical protein
MRIAYCILLLFIIGCSNYKDQPNETTVPVPPDSAKPVTHLPEEKIPPHGPDLTLYQEVFDKKLKGWYKTFSHFSLASFQPTMNDSFYSNTQNRDLKELKEFYTLHRPLLDFSPDGKQFLDIHSLGLGLHIENGELHAAPEVDYGIQYCNLQTKEWRTIYYFATSSWIEETAWISDTTFIMAGSYMDSLEKRRPMIYLGNRVTTELIEYRPKDTLIRQLDYYRSPKLLRMKIKGI